MIEIVFFADIMFIVFINQIWQRNTIHIYDVLP